MSIEDLTLLTQPISLKLPPDWIGWVGLLAFLGGVVALLWRWRGYNKPWKGNSWGILIVLALLVPVTSLFLSFHLPGGNALPPPDTYIDPGGPVVILLAALPWVAAAGLLGPLAACGLAVFSGLLLALWETHSLFTPLEMALLATMIGAALQQRYRTVIFRLLRRPLLATTLATLLYPLIFIPTAVLSVSGSLAIRLDYAITHVFLTTAALGIGLLTAGLFGEGIALSLAYLWGTQEPLQPSPVEQHLHTRFLANLAPLGIILVITLIVGDWIVAGNASRKMLNELMANNSQSAAQTIPFFVETGQNLIKQMALEPALTNVSTTAAITDVLQEQIRRVPYFTQLFYFDTEGNVVAGYPAGDYTATHPSTEELYGIESALSGVTSQFYTLPPSELQKKARISFLASVLDTQGQSRGVLVGRTELASNPFTQAVIASLKQLEQLGGDGMLVDDKGQVLYHSNESQALMKYSGPTPAEAAFFDGTAPNGTRALMYYQPIVSYSWAVVMTIPASIAQQNALGISAPLLVTLIILFVLAAVLLRLGLRRVTASLENLTTEADRIAGGELTSPLDTQGTDEVGQLRRSFEQMRLSLKARLDDLNRLLAATQGVASSLEAEQSIRPVLQAALATGANTARVVLEPAQFDGNHTAIESIGLGGNSERYLALDEQILNLTRQQERLVLANASRARMLQFPPGIRAPEALLALALRHKGMHYGALYLLFDQPHQFTNDEQRFLITLANQAALAAANARLFLGSEIERQRLDAILASTPDPVLVTDQQNRLLLANPAAWQAVGAAAETGIGQPIEQVINLSPLVNLLRYSTTKQQSSEVTMPDKRIYLATASTVVAEGRPVGRVCVMRDITHFKEVDALKSEFVATVSHDLRSPLTLMRGYATMMEMVGNLNEQQTTYVRKIITSVETMSRLVNNLLDLGRIEAGIDLQLEIIPVNDITERVIGALQLQATQKHIQLSYEMPPQTIPLVEADQALLQQALYNLVENGVKYTEAGGKVTLRICAEPDRMSFEVQDTGIGIAPVDIPRLFEKFYRGAQRESRKQTGSGLGLAIVKSIAERHGGNVHVDSQLGKGSTFSLSIPIRQPKRETRPKRETLPKRPSEPRPPGL